MYTLFVSSDWIDVDRESQGEKNMKQGKLINCRANQKKKGEIDELLVIPVSESISLLLNYTLLKTKNIYSIYVVSLPKLVSDISSKLCCVDVVL